MTFADTAVTNGTRYFYKVAAVNSVGEGGLSGEASATPSATTPPGAPTNLTATQAKPHGVTLKWTAPTTTGGSAITGYQILRSTTAGQETFLVAVGKDLQGNRVQRAHLSLGRLVLALDCLQTTYIW